MSASPAEIDDTPHPTDLTLFQQEILYTLAESGSDYGLGIKKSLEERYGENINHGRLYPNLDDLVDVGLVDKEALDNRTNEYYLSSAGKDILRRDAQRRYGIADGLGRSGSI